jgi:hypothetical protein
MDHLNALPASWWSHFDGEALQAKLDVAAVLATVDEEGWSHVTYLSAGEVLARRSGRLSIALWPGAQTAANLDRTGQAVLHAAADGAVWAVRARMGRRAPARAGTLAVFDGEILDVRRHAAPYAEVAGLVDFRLKAPSETLARWASQVADLRADGGAGAA